MSAASNDILVIGHRNPDTDAICSALAYADFYTRTTGHTAVACHLDKIGPETNWLLKHLGLEAPRQITDVYWSVEDVMLRNVPALAANTTLREAGLLMREHQLGALAVVDDRNHLIGIVPRDLLADRYLDQLRLSPHINRPLAVLSRLLEAEQLTGAADAQLNGHVWMGTFSPDVARKCLEPGDVVILEDNHGLQLAAAELKVGCMIITSGAQVESDVIAAAERNGVIIIRTTRTPLASVVLLEQSVPVTRVMQGNPASVTPGTPLNEAQEQLRSSRLASLPVVDDEGRYLGLLLRRVLIPQDRRQIILTDHNHSGQAAAGAIESEIVAIVDHHNLGGLRTLAPLTLQIEPVGCTCTLIAEGYRRAEIIPDRAIAGAMLGAILSDTVQFRSPTTTPRDKAIAAWLAEISGESIEKLAHSLFRARLPDPVPPADWWVSRDWKVFTFGETSIGIAQMELVDVEHVMPPTEALRAELNALIAKEKINTALLMLTDILEESSMLIAADSEGELIAQRAFSKTFENHHMKLPGVMSRKKQVVPPIAAALS